MADRVYPAVIGASLGLFRALDLRFTMTGTEHIPRTGGALVASNHVSYLDYLFMGRAARYPSRRYVRFMAKKEIFDKGLGGPFMRSMHHLPVDRSAGSGAFTAALAALREGELVGIYPEATISTSFELKPFKTGAARLAVGSSVPLIPMINWGGHRIITKGRKPNFRQRHVPVTILIGEPLRPGPGDDPVSVTEALFARMRAMLTTAQETYPDKPAGPEDSWSACRSRIAAVPSSPVSMR